ncbi:hypothetical protein [Photobacterium damselae]|uniref:hypothetical protein n=1 Tax=Photobacterium damselae TaxID=38293 RepID=UPI001F32BF0C|nr:hypothetical protein [Photobacterium damselae]UKA05015.1 hypothetical protein IHC89_22475 [Photobacterium damselae subsp. damselae]
MRHFYALKIKSCDPVAFCTDDHHFDGEWTLGLEDGKQQRFTFKAVYAGGFNIQLV